MYANESGLKYFGEVGEAGGVVTAGISFGVRGTRRGRNTSQAVDVPSAITVHKMMNNAPE